MVRWLKGLYRFKLLLSGFFILVGVVRGFFLGIYFGIFGFVIIDRWVDDISLEYGVLL